LENFLDIVNLIAYEKGLKTQEVQNVVKETIVDVARSLHGEEMNYSAELDDDGKNIKVFQKIEIVADDDEKLSDDINYISVTQAQEMENNLQIGDSLEYEIELSEYGRTASSNFYYKLENNIQRMIEKNIYEKFLNKQGLIVSGVVTSVDEHENTYIEIDEVRAVLPMKNRIKDESFKIRDTLQAILKHVRIDKNGIYIELSRTTPKFLEELLALEVPEVKDGSVEIVHSARIPGKRAKIALMSLQPNIDPIGCVVGTKGVRINAVSSILNDENIDCLEFSSRREIFVARALSPAVVLNVKFDKDDENLAIVTVNSSQKAKAIGKGGVNIRLASMLTQTNIEIIEEADKDGNILPATADDSSAKKDVSDLESLFK
jgi:N utilization substance protein A